MKTKILKFFLTLLTLYSLLLTLGAVSAPILAHFGFCDLSARLDFAFFPLCHRNPSRVFWILNYPMPLCARCFGVYLGTFFAGITRFQIPFIPIALIFVTDMSLNYLFKINTGNLLRFLAGICLGFVIVKILKGEKR